MSNVRIEIHMTGKETELLEKIAHQQNRSRKNLCETEIRKIIRKQLIQHSNNFAHRVTFI
jgi:hypothetical protein